MKKRKKFDININIHNGKDLVSKYNDDTLSPELKEFILNELVGVSVKRKVTIYMKYDKDLSEEDQKVIKKIIRDEFRETLDELEYERKKSDIQKLFLTFLGIAFIICSNLFGEMGTILTSVLEIFGWVAVWEVAYAIFFTDLSRKHKERRINQILKAEIIFKD